jgi:type II secretory pathway component PulC
MPALVNNNVGSLPGTSELEGTTACPFFLKNSKKLARISELVIALNLASRFISLYMSTSISVSKPKANRI